MAPIRIVLTLSLLASYCPLTTTLGQKQKCLFCCVKEAHVRITFSYSNLRDMTNSYIEISSVGEQLPHWRITTTHVCTTGSNTTGSKHYRTQAIILVADLFFVFVFACFCFVLVCTTESEHYRTLAVILVSDILVCTTESEHYRPLAVILVSDFLGMHDSFARVWGNGRTRYRLTQLTR